jgi:hypothetical protein
MTDEDVVARAAKLMGASYFQSLSAHKRNPRHKPMCVAQLSGQRAFDLMKAMFPFLGSRRQERIQHAITSYRGPLRRACSRNKDDIITMLNSGMTHAQVAAKMGCTPSNISAFAVRLRLSGVGIPDKRNRALRKIDVIAKLLMSGLTHREAGYAMGCSHASITRCAKILRGVGMPLPESRRPNRSPRPGVVDTIESNKGGSVTWFWS